MLLCLRLMGAPVASHLHASLAWLLPACDHVRSRLPACHDVRSSGQMWCSHLSSWCTTAVGFSFAATAASSTAWRAAGSATASCTAASDVVLLLDCCCWVSLLEVACAELSCPLLLRSRWTSPLRHAASASLLATTLRRALSAIVLQDQSSDMVQNDGAVQCRVLMQNGGR